MDEKQALRRDTQELAGRQSTRRDTAQLGEQNIVHEQRQVPCGRSVRQVAVGSLISLWHVKRTRTFAITDLM